MLPREALIAGSLFSVAGVSYLAVMCNWLSAILAALTIVIYIFAYTPLKRISTFNTLVGAVPGALPPMIGWTAATGRLELAAWSLFAILFFGSCLTSSPLPGCIGQITRAPDSKWFRAATKRALAAQARVFCFA